MRFRQWVRLRRKPDRAFASADERMDYLEHHSRTNRVGGLVLYVIVIGALAAAAAGAGYAAQAARDASRSARDASDAVATAEAARATRVKDQAATNSLFCARQRQAFIRDRQIKLIEAKFAGIFLGTIQQLLNQAPAAAGLTDRQQRSRAVLQATATDLRREIAKLTRAAATIKRTVYGDPKAPRGSIARRGIVCGSSASRPLKPQ